MDGKRKKALLIIASKDFRDEEFFETRKVLEGAEIEIEVASDQTGIAKGMLGGGFEVKKSIIDISIADYDAVVFIGGTGAVTFMEDAIALAIIEEANRQSKVVAAICIAPLILANAGILAGKRATISPLEKEKLVAKGVLYTEEPVVVDGRIVTAFGPTASSAFGWKIVELLGQSGKILAND